MAVGYSLFYYVLLLSSNDVYTLAVLLLKLPNKQWNVLNLSNCNITEKSCDVFCEVFRTQNVAPKVKSVNISYNKIQFESLSKLCNLLRNWQTKELTLSIDILYDKATMNAIKTFTSKLQQRLQANWFKEQDILLITWFAKHHRILLLYASKNKEVLSEYVYCNKVDHRSIELVMQRLKSKYVKTVSHLVFIYAPIDVDKCSTLLSCFQHVRLYGSCFHSKGALLLGNAVNVEYFYKDHSIQQCILDYMSTSLYNPDYSSSSYLQTLPVERVEKVKNGINYCLTYFSASSRSLFVQNIRITSKSNKADDISLILSCNFHIQKLYISKINLRTLGAIKIANALKSTSLLTVINISDNNIGSEAANDIASALSHNFNLQEFYATNNSLETSGAIKIAKGLKNILSLKDLFISSNNIGSEAADDIASVLSHSFNLQRFWIDNNNLETSGAIKIARALQNITSLQHLNISNNNIGSVAATFIESILFHNTEMRVFYNNGNNFETRGAIKIARGLQSTKFLQAFYISYNSAGSKGGNHVYINIQIMPWDCSCRISEKNLGTIEKTGAMNCTSYASLSNTDSGAANELDAILYHINLQTCSITGIKFETSAAIRFAKVFTHDASSLNKFYISNCTINGELADYISDVLYHSTKLQEL